METSISFASLLALTISRASMWLLESLYNRFFLSIALSRKAIGHLANSGMKVCSAKLLSPRLFQVWSEYLPGLAIQIRWGFCNLACKVWSEQALRLFHLAECALAIHSKCHLIRLNIHSIDHNLEKVCQDQVSRGFAAGICRFFSCSNPCFSTDKLYWNFTEKDLKFVLGIWCFLLAVTLFA